MVANNEDTIRQRSGRISRISQARDVRKSQDRSPSPVKHKHNTRGRPTSPRANNQRNTVATESRMPSPDNSGRILGRTIQVVGNDARNHDGCNTTRHTKRSPSPVKRHQKQSQLGRPSTSKKEKSQVIEATSSRKGSSPSPKGRSPGRGRIRVNEISRMASPTDSHHQDRVSTKTHKSMDQNRRKRSIESGRRNRSINNVRGSSTTPKKGKKKDVECGKGNRSFNSKERGIKRSPSPYKSSTWKGVSPLRGQEREKADMDDPKDESRATISPENSGRRQRVVDNKVRKLEVEKLLNDKEGREEKKSISVIPGMDVKPDMMPSSREGPENIESIVNTGAFKVISADSSKQQNGSSRRGVRSIFAAWHRESNGKRQEPPPDDDAELHPKVEIDDKVEGFVECSKMQNKKSISRRGGRSIFPWSKKGDGEMEGYHDKALDEGVLHEGKEKEKEEQGRDVVDAKVVQGKDDTVVEENSVRDLCKETEPDQHIYEEEEEDRDNALNCAGESCTTTKPISNDTNVFVCKHIVGLQERFSTENFEGIKSVSEVEEQKKESEILVKGETVNEDTKIKESRTEQEFPETCMPEKLETCMPGKLEKKNFAAAEESGAILSQQEHCRLVLVSGKSKDNSSKNILRTMKHLFRGSKKTSNLKDKDNLNGHNKPSQHEETEQSIGDRDKKSTTNEQEERREQNVGDQEADDENHDDHDGSPSSCRGEGGVQVQTQQDSDNTTVISYGSYRPILVTKTKKIVKTKSKDCCNHHSAGDYYANTVIAGSPIGSKYWAWNIDSNSNKNQDVVSTPKENPTTNDNGKTTNEKMSLPSPQSKQQEAEISTTAAPNTNTDSYNNNDKKTRKTQSHKFGTEDPHEFEEEPIGIFESYVYKIEDTIMDTIQMCCFGFKERRVSKKRKII